MNTQYAILHKVGRFYYLRDGVKFEDSGFVGDPAKRVWYAQKEEHIFCQPGRYDQKALEGKIMEYAAEKKYSAAVIIKLETPTSYGKSSRGYERHELTVGLGNYNMWPERR